MSNSDQVLIMLDLIMLVLVTSFVSNKSVLNCWKCLLLSEFEAHRRIYHSTIRAWQTVVHADITNRCHYPALHYITLHYI